MKKIALLLFLTCSFLPAIAEDENAFSGIENAVGYIKTTDGQKYIVIETENGAKLIKVSKDPENIIGENQGISKEDFKIK